MTSAAPSTRAASREAAPPLDVLAVHAQGSDFVWRSLQRLGVRPSDLEDVCQEVFVVVHKRLHTFDGSSALTTWLFGICLRVAAAHRRRAWFRREVPTEDLADDRAAPSHEHPDEALAAREARARLDRVLDRMDLDKRAVFVMFEIDELSSEEIADVLGVPVGTVYSRLSAARKQFTKILARERAREGSAAGGLSWIPGAVFGAGLGAVVAVGVLVVPELVAPEAPAPRPSVTVVASAASQIAPAPSTTAPIASVTASADRPAPRVPAVVSAPSGAESAAPPGEDPLAQEAALLEQARAALAGNPAEALAIAESHAARFPSGKLSMERELVAIDALRRLGRVGEARARGEAVLARAKGSLYEPRIRKLIEGDPR